MSQSIDCKNSFNEACVVIENPFYKIIFDRFNFNMKCCLNRKKSDVELITLRRYPNINNFDTISELEIDSIVTLSEFKIKCKRARKLCRKYAKIFMYLEILSKVISSFGISFQIIVSILQIDLLFVCIVAAISFFVIFVESIGDWSKLREKYSELHEQFGKIANCKEDELEEKINLFHEYALRLGTGHLAIDISLSND